MKFALAFLAAALLAATPAAAESAAPIVFAAASLKGPLDEAAAAFKAETGVAVTISYAGSNALAKQIEEGAPAELFISADEDWMNELAAKNLIRPETRADLLANELALIAPADSALALAPAPGFALAAALGDSRLATADPDSVPAGKYAKAALEQMGLWEKAKGNAVFAENVRAALEFVRKGAARAAIVYASDLKAAPELRAAYTFAPETHAPILYPAALVRENETARAFLDFLSSPEGQAIFAEWGFTPAGAVN